MQLSAHHRLRFDQQFAKFLMFRVDFPHLCYVAQVSVLDRRLETQVLSRLNLEARFGLIGAALGPVLVLHSAILYHGRVNRRSGFSPGKEETRGGPSGNHD